MSTLYVGTYTEPGRRDGIHILDLDIETGALRRVGTADGGRNPSFLATHPNGRTLYAVNELSGVPGLLRAFAIDAASGALALVSELGSQGTAPCYVSTDLTGEVAMVANYISGTVALFPVGEGGALASASHVVQHVGSGPVVARQDRPHAHCIVPHPSNRFVLAADLGADRVLVYEFDDACRALVPRSGSDAVLPPGTGPRHLAFHPDLPLVFVVGELSSTITVLHCDPTTAALSVIETLSTFPSPWTGTNYPADVHVAPGGRAVYVSNRGHDSVAVFSVQAETGRLVLEHVESSGGDWPRSFSLDPSGRWLVVANQRSNTLAVFARNEESGRLAPTPHSIDVPSPVCVRFRA